ncbi:hypothetical protein CICLE_v10004081mg [Citrus x clementina]|uniref:Uncharacterized protein n=1 Tax=Citrus clementina TaxID=85681 RepID=V4SBT3_CITCL|nr:hypothetical protein CICLE_v10004081mg [Citrus x clementina]
MTRTNSMAGRNNSRDFWQWWRSDFESRSMTRTNSMAGRNNSHDFWQWWRSDFEGAVVGSKTEVVVERALVQPWEG